MKCPHCLFDALDWHSVCLRCHRPIHSPHSPTGARKSIDRHRLLVTLSSWSLTAFFLVGSLVMIRLIDWGGLISLLQPEPPPMIAEVEEERETPRHGRRPPRGGIPHERLAAAEQETSRTQGEGTETDSVRNLTGRLEELPAGRTADLAAGPPNRPRREAQPLDETGVMIEQIDPPPTDTTGLVTISAYTPARIYIDGQYSGVTPRTVHLVAGEYQIRLVADGYVEWSSRVSVKKRQQLGVLASLTRTEP